MLPSLRRRLMLILGVFSATVLVALLALLIKQNDVRNLVQEGNLSTVPAIVELQQASANLERMLRFGWIAATASDPKDWRPAGRAAQALSYHPSLAVHEGVRENVRALYSMVRKVMDLREQALILRSKGQSQLDIVAQRTMLTAADDLDQQARALWAPQDSLLLKAQSALAAEMSKMTIDHFDRIDRIASTTQIAAMGAAGVMLLALLGAAILIHRDLFRPVLQISDALRSILDEGRGAQLEQISPTSSEVATMYDAAHRLRQALEDVTEQARALQEGESRLQSLFDASDAGIGITDAGGIIVAANAALCRLSDQQDDDLVGCSLTMGTHPEDLVEEAEVLDDLKSGKRHSARLEKRYLHGDRTVVWVESNITALTDPDGRISGFVTVVIDTTEQHRAREQLLFTQSIIDKSSEPVYCVDPSDGYRFVYVNAATCRHYGMDRETLLRMRVGDFDSGYRLVTDCLEYYGAAMLSDALIKETSHTLSDGTELPVEISANYFIYRGHDYIAGYIRDIRDRKRWMDEVQRSNHELQQFAYVASHDLQEPLRMVASFLQLLRQRHASALPPEAQEYITYAVDGAVRMKQIIEDLLQYSRLEKSKRTMEPVDLTVSCDTAVMNLRDAIQSSQAQVVCQGNLGWVLADSGQLARLLQNLIGNAIKYRHPERVPKVEVRITEEDKATCTVAVSDNGIGIDSYYFERIFLIFQRLHSNQEYPGTGIGLAICKRIVEHCGGQIWVSSTVGEGSTFYFTLKRMQKPPEFDI